MTISGSNTVVAPCNMNVAIGADSTITTTNGGAFNPTSTLYIGAAGSPPAAGSAGSSTFTLNAYSGAMLKSIWFYENTTFNLSGQCSWFKLYNSFVAGLNITLNFDGCVLNYSQNGGSITEPAGNFVNAYIKKGGLTVNTGSGGSWTWTDTPLQSGVSSGIDGGLTVVGTGWLQLNGPQTFTGPVVINSGATVYMPNCTFPGAVGDVTFYNSAYIINNGIMNMGSSASHILTIPTSQTLMGGGSISSGNGLTVNGTIAPSALGDGTKPIFTGTTTKTFTSGQVTTLAGTAVMNLNRTNAINADLLTTGYHMNLGGNLIVTNVGPALQVGDTFNLFHGGTGFSGSFANITLPSEYTWTTTMSGGYYTVTVASLLVQPRATIANVDYSQLAAYGIISFNAMNGVPNGAYTLLMSTNVALPPSDWTAVASGNLDSNGNLSGLSVPVGPGNPQQFFILMQ